MKSDPTEKRVGPEHEVPPKKSGSSDNDIPPPKENNEEEEDDDDAIIQTRSDDADDELTEAPKKFDSTKMAPTVVDDTIQVLQNVEAHGEELEAVPVADDVEILLCRSIETPVCGDNDDKVEDEEATEAKENPEDKPKAAEEEAGAATAEAGETPETP